MLRELTSTRQVSGEPIRKWFTGNDIDLILWYVPGDEIIGFQLCYGKGSDERALTWWKNKGFSHDKIDDGEGRPDNQKMSPILVPDGAFDKDKLLAHFRERSRELDPELVQFVAATIGRYPQVGG
jgi:hypothetical protein